ncbi:MAG TPA: MBL fold metallo-hydrolase, partial [Dehalococcoidia bacterium]|nr:MBL fold metallo-hydrolase [Dehalococcoidia bacterium]
DGVVAIDTCFTEKRSRWFYDAVRKTAGSKAIRTLVNTHHHGDHTHGNYVFLPAATIIGHELCREEVIAAGLSTKGMFPGVDWGEIVVAPPVVTFEDRLNLYVDNLRIELIFVGPAHTTNDIVAWIPERKVLFSGDIVFNEGTPFAMMGSVAGWLGALDRLKELGIERIVPGHGPACGPEVLDEVGDYLRMVQASAKKGLEAGLGPLETAYQTDLGHFGELLDRERLVGNLHRAFSELRGEPRGTSLNLGAIVPEMVQYNGGKMPRCVA